MSNGTMTKKHFYNGTPYDEKSLTSFLFSMLEKNEEWFLKHSSSLEATFKARGELLDQKTPNGFCSHFENYRLLVEYLGNLK
jgi:hypothetical protein